MTNELKQAVDRLRADKESVDMILAGRPDKTQTSPSRRFWQDVTLVLTALSSATERAEAAEHKIDAMRDRINSDSYAMTFQSMGQYRTALLKAIEVEHWEPAVAQAAWEHYRDEIKEKRNDER